jgi:hypothetical protein
MHVVRKLVELSINGHLSMPALLKINYPLYKYVKGNFSEIQEAGKEYGLILSERRGDYELAKHLLKFVDDEGRLRRLRVETNETERKLYRRIWQRASKYGMGMGEYIEYLGFIYLGSPPHFYREIVKLKEQGYSNPEIAKILKCSHTTVWYYLNRKEEFNLPTEEVSHF